MDKVLGFELGVGDYVTKPLSLLELLGRIQAVLPRSGRTEAASGGALPFGLLLTGLGTADVDDLHLKVVGADVPVTG